MTASMASLASSRPAVDEPMRCRDVDAEDSDADDGETSPGRRSRMTTATSVDDSEERLDTSAVELEMQSHHCTPLQGSRHCHRCCNPRFIIATDRDS